MGLINTTFRLYKTVDFTSDLQPSLGDNIVFDIDVPDGGADYFTSEFGADAYDVPIEIKLQGVGTGSSARIGKLSIKYRE